MPLLRLETNIEINPEKCDRLHSELADLVSELLGKSKAYVQIVISSNTPMSFGGDTSPTAHIQLISLGLPSDFCKDISRSLTNWASEYLEIDPKRIYISMSDWPRSHWAWDGKPFG